MWVLLDAPRILQVMEQGNPGNHRDVAMVGLLAIIGNPPYLAMSLLGLQGCVKAHHGESRWNMPSKSHSFAQAGELHAPRQLAEGQRGNKECALV